MKRWWKKGLKRGGGKGGGRISAFGLRGQLCPFKRGEKEKEEGKEFGRTRGGGGERESTSKSDFTSCLLPLLLQVDFVVGGSRRGEEKGKEEGFRKARKGTVVTTTRTCRVTPELSGGEGRGRSPH